MRPALRLSLLISLAVCVAIVSSVGAEEDCPASAGTLDQLLWTAVSRAERTVVTQLESRLEAQLTRLEARLETQFSRLEARLDRLEGGPLQADCSRLEARLTEVSDRLDRHISTTHTNTTQDPSTNTTDETPTRPPARDCSDLQPGTHSGVYLLHLGLGNSLPVPAFCDLDSDGGGWTVLQRRADIEPREDFYRDWAAYKEGFGELDAEFWWGLENMWAMTAPRDRQYELRINLEDFDGGERFAIYQNFRISSESDGYRLSAANYSGDAGNSLSHHIGNRFSTKDKDQDQYNGNCAERFKGAWWYGDCHDSNLNGQYLAGAHSSYADGINWETFRGDNYSLKATAMKIRPTKKFSSERR